MERLRRFTMTNTCIALCAIIALQIEMHSTSYKFYDRILFVMPGKVSGGDGATCACRFRVQWPRTLTSARSGNNSLVRLQRRIVNKSPRFVSQNSQWQHQMRLACRLQLQTLQSAELILFAALATVRCADRQLQWTCVFAIAICK